MDWVLLVLFIIVWIIAFIKLFKAVKELDKFETTGKGNARVQIKQFMICLILGVVITLLILMYSALE